MREKDFTSKEKWKGIILFGLNAATYKIALVKSLLRFSALGKTLVTWDELSENYLNDYLQRLGDSNMPQHGVPHIDEL